MESSPRAQLAPFLKWAGGKRWLTARIAEICPANGGRYFEPFLGSGAIFFHQRPLSAVLSDLNAELIEAYAAIKDDYAEVWRHLRLHARSHSSQYYYKVREMSCRTAHTRAARFIYLNRTCWNGLYRVNLAGRFNVPVGTKTQVLLDNDNFPEIAAALRRTELICCDFETTIDRANEGDVIFVDPPYTVRHKHNGFIKYNETLFSWDDQVRLKHSLERAKNRGARIVLTNADHESIRRLYVGDFRITELSRYSAIAGASRSRGTFSELLIE